MSIDECQCLGSLTTADHRAVPHCKNCQAREFFEFLRVVARAINDAPTFYILDTRTSVGNCASWWAPNGQGYVCDLRQAGIYTEADKAGKRDTDVFVPHDVAWRNAVTHVRVDVQEMRPYMRRGDARRVRR